MQPTSIIAQMRRIVKVDTSQYDDDDALIDLNTLKDEFWSTLVWVWKKFNWEKWKTSSVALQSEYQIPEVASDTAWAKQLSWIAVCYDGETYEDTWELKYIPVKLVDKDSLEHDWDYYIENQRVESPIAYVADNSYFIAPAFRAVVTNGIKLTGIRKIPDYTLSTTETEMKLPIDQHQTLVYGLCVFWHMNKWSEPWIVSDAEARYERKVQKAIDMTRERIEETPFINEYPQ